MQHNWMRWRRASRRGVSPVIATILLVAITVVLAAVLYGYLSVSTPNQSPSISFIAKGFQSQQAWGDPTDCTNTTQYATCNSIPAVFMIFTSQIPQALLLSQLVFLLRCNGTSLVNGTLEAMEIVPGSGASPSPSSPVLGKCGNWTPSASGNQATFFNRLAYYQQLFPGKTTLQDGDTMVIYAHPPGNFCDRNGNCPDDDFHGAPLWCFSVPGDCTAYILDKAAGNLVVAQLPLYGLAPI
ncbi:MAG: archaellin/type IV pilin N-terminal domain-containing protein [Thermoplasmata archaeon]